MKILVNDGISMPLGPSLWSVSATIAGVGVDAVVTTSLGAGVGGVDDVASVDSVAAGVTVVGDGVVGRGAVV